MCRLRCAAATSLVFTRENSRAHGNSFPASGIYIRERGPSIPKLSLFSRSGPRRHPSYGIGAHRALTRRHAHTGTRRLRTKLLANDSSNFRKLLWDAPLKAFSLRRGDGKHARFGLHRVVVAVVLRMYSAHAPRRAFVRFQRGLDSRFVENRNRRRNVRSIASR